MAIPVSQEGSKVLGDDNEAEAADRFPWSHVNLGSLCTQMPPHALKAQFRVLLPACQLHQHEVLTLRWEKALGCGLLPVPENTGLAHVLCIAMIIPVPVGLEQL